MENTISRCHDAHAGAVSDFCISHFSRFALEKRVEKHKNVGDVMERKKYCPVCHGLVAVYQGDVSKYGDRAEWNWNRFIRLKYDCDECRAIMKGQSTRLSNTRRRKERREQSTVLLDIVEAYRQESRLLRERIDELEREKRERKAARL